MSLLGNGMFADVMDDQGVPAIGTKVEFRGHDRAVSLECNCPSRSRGQPIAELVKQMPAHLERRFSRRTGLTRDPGVLKFPRPCNIL